jgi:hypothetical protein
MNCTFLAKSEPELIEREVEVALSYLSQNEFIVLNTTSNQKENDNKQENMNETLSFEQKKIHKETALYEITSLGAATYRFVQLVFIL